MQSHATNPDEYLAQLPTERREAMTELRRTILENLPEGFVETMSYGMIGYIVPHSSYASGYHAKPKDPLPFINIASQTNHIALYHMGLYANEGLLSWFVGEYEAASGRKIDMGKGCVRFKPREKIPYELIGALVRKISMKQWIAAYEKQRMVYATVTKPQRAAARRQASGPGGDS